MNIMNNEASTTATDMHNMASDTQQAGTGIGQSSPNIDLDAITGPDIPTPKETTPKRTHGDITSDINKYEAEIDKINEVQELFRNNKIIEAMNLANQLGFNINDYNENQGKLKDGFKFEDIANLIDPRKSELLNNIKDLKEHESYDPRTDEQKRADQLLADERAREDSAAQRGTQDMLKAGLHPASANYGGSIGGSSGGSSGGGGGSGGSESEKEKERRRRRKKQLEERRIAREREKRQNVITLLSRMGSAATYGGMRTAAFRPKSMNNPTNTNKVISNNKVKMNEPDWLNEYLGEIKEMKPVNEYKPTKTNREKEDREIYNRLMKKQLNKIK